jgi:hypothetical protein
VADTVTELAQAFPTAPAPLSSSGGSSSTETPLGSKPGHFLGKEEAPLKAMGEANQAIVGATKEEGENQVNRAVIGQETADAGAGQAAENFDQMRAITDIHNANIEAEKARIQPMIEAADKFQFHQYWSDKGTGDKVMAALSSALLGFGTGQYHNVAMDLAEKDHQRQVSELNGLLERAKLGGASLDRLMQIQDHAMLSMAAMQAAKYKAIAAKAEQMGAAAGTVEAKTNADMISNMAMKKSAAEIEELWKGLRTKAARSTAQHFTTPKEVLP